MYHEYRKIMVVAGEASGDLHAASLVEALKRIDHKLQFYGVGGEKLCRAGVRLMADSADMAVVGFTEVFAKLPFIVKVMRELKSSFVGEKPDAVILVDYPDFNLNLAKAAHKRGIKVFYYISPQIWAWRKGRIRKIRRYVDCMAVILPFELPLYQKAGIDAGFVGHPLMDAIPPQSSPREARKKLGIEEGVTTVSILPGSRPGEVMNLLPIFLQAAEIMNQGNNLQFLLPLACTLSRDFVEDMIRRCAVRVTVVENGIYDVLSASDLAIVASGTATLEAALMETPMVIVYRVSWLSYLLGRLFIRLENIGLVNIISGKTIVTELIQNDANPMRISQVAMQLLSNYDKRKEMKSELSKVKSRLGTPGAAERAARMAYNLISSPGK